MPHLDKDSAGSTETQGIVLLDRNGVKTICAAATPDMRLLQKWKRLAATAAWYVLTMSLACMSCSTVAKSVWAY